MEDVKVDFMYVNYNVFTLFFTTCVIDLFVGILEQAGYNQVILIG